MIRSMTWSAALVTGASNGIGKEIARQLAGARLTVYVGFRTIERGQGAVDEIGATPGCSSSTSLTRRRSPTRPRWSRGLTSS
jgi:NAD(P)-dependent dehydrogenase (short-subunit alcohol dehydrogenase family)